ncbi:MAG: hypothetical protein BWK80_15470 [Desulfobacteraceae bacterium IS3]|nr:MAG: hypothetical protein BWK80_15470 [Desulfobacteraceae bacterium IS3]
MPTINGQDLSSFSMIDLFRSEVEVHAATLNEGLLALENEAGDRKPQTIESLMRAAHSIKGGARIVDLDAVVKLAHTMEDCFVSLQKGEGGLSAGLKPIHIDTLLKGVDMITRISEIAAPGMEEWLSVHRLEIDSLLDAMSLILSGAPDNTAAVLPPLSPLPAPPPVQKSAPEPAGASAPESPVSDLPGTDLSPDTTETSVSGKTADLSPLAPTAGSGSEVRGEGVPLTPDLSPPHPAPGQRQGEKDRMIRVTAAKIERLMALAGEVTVNVRWLPPFFKSLSKLKKNHVELLHLLEKMQEMLAEIQNTENDVQNHSGLVRGSCLCNGVRVPGSGVMREKSDFQSSVLSLAEMSERARVKSKDSSHYLTETLNQLELYTNSSENLSDRLYHEVIRVRMRPFADGIRAFPRIVRDMQRTLGKKVRLNIIGEATEVDRDILEKLDAPLNHLLRNAIDHGIEFPKDRIAAGKPETATLTVEAAHRSGILMITVSDDGRGINLDELRKKIREKGLANEEMISRLTESELTDFLFLPGFSTLDSVSEISGRGVGLDVVHSMVHEVGGVVRVISRPGKGLSFSMELPLTLSVVRTFLVEISKEPYAFPLARIDRCLILDRKDIETVEDREYFILDKKNISLVDIHDILEIEKTPSPSRLLMRGAPADDSENLLKIVIISDRLHSYGLVVDDFLGECDLVVRPLDRRLGKIPDISAAAVMLDGSPVLIFDTEDLVRSVDSVLTGKRRLAKIGRQSPLGTGKKQKHILVADDSITVREMERKLLESRGYQVEVAVDGMDAWNLLRIATYDMVVSDIDMPRMNGFELITQIKQHEKLRSLPVMIVSYKNKEEDRLRGLEAGANYYLTKSSFQDNSFIEAVVDLIGEA